MLTPEELKYWFSIIDTLNAAQLDWLREQVELRLKEAGREEAAQKEDRENMKKYEEEMRRKEKEELEKIYRKIKEIS